ncbi:DUF4129 domain-containing protein [Conexibacter woesei]|uniref:DUF4129 domain-containing protein n=1 Tax=Conexibacter woesei TaxID=191495 RepID=UPI000419C441|nr:DUF4129 domain-containing protein [Conexibacter woesei]
MTAAEARAQARDILAQDRFQEHHHSGGPLHSLFVTFGNWLEDLRDAMPGGAVSGDVTLAVIVVVLVAAVTFVAVRYHQDRARRAAAHRVAGPGDVPGAAAAGPAELERQAADADRAGDHDLAVRLRFAAGLLRLDAARAIALRPSLTSGDVGRTLRSETYNMLAATHDAVAYGGRHASPDDAESARRDWPAVVGEARRG